MLSSKKQQNLSKLLIIFSVCKKTSFWAKLVASALIFGLFVPSVQAAEEKARRADDFVDSVGVNTHLYYNESVYYKRYNDLIKPKLLELGVRHIRDGCVYNLNGYMDRLRELKELGGIRATLVCDPRDIKVNEAVDLVKEIGTDVVEAVQATNEYNLSSNGNWANTLRNYQKQLWQAVKGDSATSGIKVFGPSLVEAGAYNTLGDMSAYQDYGTMNNYMSGRNPGNTGWGSVEAPPPSLMAMEGDSRNKP